MSGVYCWHMENPVNQERLIIVYNDDDGRSDHG